jgi:hypothetical protein
MSKKREPYHSAMKETDLYSVRPRDIQNNILISILR